MGYMVGKCCLYHSVTAIRRLSVSINNSSDNTEWNIYNNTKICCCNKERLKCVQVDEFYRNVSNSNTVLYKLCIVRNKHSFIVNICYASLRRKTK